VSASILIFGYGNPGRGDDALGPELVAAIEAMHLPDVECLSDMQLQVEHVTDLTGRDKIIFVDADVSSQAPYQLETISAEKDDSYTSHAMTPQALLHAYDRVYRRASPPARTLHIRGYQFELGQTLSSPAKDNLQAAITLISDCVAENHQHKKQLAG